MKNDLTKRFIILSCKGDQKGLNEIINEVVFDLNTYDLSLVLSGLAGAIHEFNLLSIRGSLKN